MKIEIQYDFKRLGNDYQVIPRIKNFEGTMTEFKQVLNFGILELKK